MGLSRGRRSRHIDSPREAEIADRLLDDARENPLVGRPITPHASPFYLTTSDYLKAVSGPPAWSARLARIERLRGELHETLSATRAEYLRRYAGRPEQFASQWRGYLARVDLSDLNLLIEKHNAYYPIEAGLRMQWPSGRYILPRGIPYPMAPVTPETLLREYPAEPTAEAVSRQA